MTYFFIFLYVVLISVLGTEPCLSRAQSGVSVKLSSHASSCRSRISLPDQSSSPLFSSPSTIWLCSFNANKKMESISFNVWMNILRRVPKAVLLLMVSSACVLIIEYPYMFTSSYTSIYIIFLRRFLTM